MCCLRPHLLVPFHMSASVLAMHYRMCCYVHAGLGAPVGVEYPTLCMCVQYTMSCNDYCDCCNSSLTVFGQQFTPCLTLASTTYHIASTRTHISCRRGQHQKDKRQTVLQHVQRQKATSLPSPLLLHPLVRTRLGRVVMMVPILLPRCTFSVGSMY